MKKFALNSQLQPMFKCSFCVFLILLQLYPQAWNSTSSTYKAANLLSILKILLPIQKSKPRTTDAQWSLSSIKSKTFGLDLINFGAFGEFSAKLSALFCHCYCYCPWFWFSGLTHPKYILNSAYDVGK